MSETAVDRIYKEFQDTYVILQETGEISLCAANDANARKALLLAAASFFEYTISNEVLLFCREIAGKNPLVSALVKNKAIARQHHTWFQWDSSNASNFFGLFGSEFKKHMEEKLKSERELQDSIKSFLEIGRDRNRLVHGDFATFALEKTAEEIYSLYKAALPFVLLIPKELRNCSNGLNLAEGDEAGNDA